MNDVPKRRDREERPAMSYRPTECEKTDGIDSYSHRYFAGLTSVCAFLLFLFSLFLFCVFMLTRMKVCPLEGDSKLWMWISLEDVRESESRMKRHQQGVRICWTALAHVVHLSAWQSALCARSNQNKLSNPWPVHLSQRFHVSSAN